MGVPKFFRYVSERYPCLSELAREQSIPEFDNMYLDMNGIIHNCSHPDDTNIHFSITEEDIFKDIFNYIDKLFFLIKPQKLFFMAIDGVAPRAKMNQQRSRRFRSAKDAELLEQQAMRRGEVRETERFDSNCITPGTEFMSRLHEAMQYYIKCKISNDKMWQKCRVILSGQNSPGEGEHKIMDYIRYLKAQPDYNPNTRHCLYGLDADLTILGLCTHELHFVVLREEVKFGRKPKRTSLEETRFFLLHLGLFREYLELEFDGLRHQGGSFDIAQLIDDWVLMGFLVGNDFIPHLPCMHISSNALPLLYKTYIDVYPTLGGNINVHGKLNLERLEKYFAALSLVEFDLFQQNYADLKYFDGKESKNGVDVAFDFNTVEIANNENADEDLAALIESSRKFMADIEDEDLSDDDGKHIADEFEAYKRNYYMKKLHENDMCSERKREQAIGYVTALQWILDYYYCGVQSWDWYYPHHYAPFISDLKNFKDHVIHFNMGTPFRPFEQLLAVLPAASKELLPLAYHDLMTSVSSALIDYYPSDFETDLNGKKHEWEAVVLIPFIDEKILLAAMKSCESRLSDFERERNKHGPMLQYDFCEQSQGKAPGVYSMKTLYSIYCTERQLWARDIAISSKRTVCVELPNASRHVFFPGFPTMKHLNFDFQVRSCRVKVFDHPSRNETMVLKPKNRLGLDDLFIVAEKYFHQVVFIGWPHLIKAKVVGVFNAEKYLGQDGLRDNSPKAFENQMKSVNEHLSSRMAIEFSDCSVMVDACIYTGTSFICGSRGTVIAKDMFSKIATAYPAQGVVAEIAVHDELQDADRTIDDLFPTNATIFFVGNPYFGSEGTVLDPHLIYECGRLKVSITVLPEPDFELASAMQAQHSNDYVTTHQAAGILGIHPKCLGRVTGTVLVIAGAKRPHPTDNIAKANIGLQLKFPKQSEERAGYARRSSNQWYYSSKALALVQAYYERFPMVFNYLSSVSDRTEFCFETDLFPASVGEGRIEEISAWLKAQPHMKGDRVACGSKIVELEAVEEVIAAVEDLKLLPVKSVKLQVKPHLLLKPDTTLPIMYRPKRAITLFDRVVIVRTTYMVPIGSKGTVIGVYPVSDPNPVRLECVNNTEDFYEVLFDKVLPNGNDIYGIAPGRVYRVPPTSVLLITEDVPNEQPEASVGKQQHQPRQQQPQRLQQAQRQQLQQQANPERQHNKSAQAKQPAQLPRDEPKYNSAKMNDSYLSSRKGGADFWMPAAETKIKHSQRQNQQDSASEQTARAKQVTNTNDDTNGKKIQILQKRPPVLQEPGQQQQPEPLPLPVVQMPSLLTQQSRPQQSQIDSSQEKTMMLRNLLGLTNPADNCDKREAPRNQLPQPPQVWRTDAQNSIQMATPSSAPALPNHYMPQPMMAMPMPSAAIDYNYGYMMMPLRPQNPFDLTPLAQPGIRQAFAQPPAFYPIIQAPQPQPPRAPADNSCFSPESLNQKGAFIPLQAMRNGQQTSSQPSFQQRPQRNAMLNNSLQSVELLENMSEMSLNSMSSEMTEDTNNVPSNNINDTPEAPAPVESSFRQRKPRVPKIGARFDNMP